MSVFISVVVQFFPWFKFYFPLFWGMVIYDNGFKQRKIKFKPGKKLNHNISNRTRLNLTSTFYIKITPNLNISARMS